MIEISRIKGGFIIDNETYMWNDGSSNHQNYLEQYCMDCAYEFAEECREFFENSHMIRDNKIEIGEYFFDEIYGDEFDWECLEMNLSSELKAINEEFEDFDLHTWSSKSGTSVFVSVNLNMFENEIMNTYLENSENKNRQYKFIKEYVENVNLYIQRMEDLKEKLIEELKKAEEVVKIYASGVKTGNFSNGEAVFSRLDHEGNIRAGGILTGKYDEEMGFA